MITAIGGGYDNATGMHSIDLHDYSLRVFYFPNGQREPLWVREGDTQYGHSTYGKRLFAKMTWAPMCLFGVTVTATSSDPGAVLIAPRYRAEDHEFVQTASQVMSNDRYLFGGSPFLNTAWFYVRPVDDADSDDETVTITVALTLPGDVPVVTHEATVTVEDDD